MPRIVHLGLGNFARAHVAWYTQAANRIGPEVWRITGVSMRQTAIRDAMERQGYHYTLAMRGANALQTEEVDAIDRVLVAAQTPDAVIDAIADPEVQVVTMTITEKGYFRAALGGLDLSDPDIQADLASGPATAIGLLTRGLAKRQADGAGPLTVISLDNLPENGRVLQKSIVGFADAADLEIGAHIAFPNTMVDRITPATTDAIRAEIAAHTGRDDAIPVMTEAFSDWVIEDHFATPIPPWDQVGATIAPDVAPYEARKLLILNAAHSALAYAGLRKGHTYVHEAISDPNLRRMVAALWAEAEAAIPAELRQSLAGYHSDLLGRFSVPQMKHRLDQIAIDGSQKIPVRIGPILRARGPQNAPAAVSVIASWIGYMRGAASASASIVDPGATPILEKIKNGADDRQIVQAVINQTALSDPTEELSEQIISALRDA